MYSSAGRVNPGGIPSRMPVHSPPRMPTRPPLYRVGRSKIQGRGLFAARSIRRGTRIVEYTGTLLTEDEANAKDQSKRVALFTLSDGWFLDGDEGGDATYANHSCEPNAHSENIDNHIWIVADRTIRPGEEILYDYRLGWDEEICPCHCGAPTCRGTMNLLPPRSRTPRRRR